MISYGYRSDLIGKPKQVLITDGTVTVSGTSYSVTGDTVTLENPDIEAESFSLTQSVNSGPQIQLGSCEAAQLSVTFRKTVSAQTLVGKTVKAYVMPYGDASKMLQLGVFKIAEEKQSSHSRRHEITAYDAMYDILNDDVVSWYNELLPDKDASTTLAAMRASFLQRYDLTVESITLPNDSLTIRRTLKDEKDSLSGAEVIKAICELNGAYGVITNTGSFRFLILKNMYGGSEPSGMAEIPMDEYSSIEFGRVSLPIMRFRIYSDTAEGDSGRPASDAYDTYRITDNFLVADFTTGELTGAATALSRIFYERQYCPCTVTATGDPTHEPGDPVKVIRGSGSYFYSYIFERKLTGIQAMKDTYAAKGSGKLSYDLNSITRRLEQAQSEARSSSSSSAQSGLNFPEIIRDHPQHRLPASGRAERRGSGMGRGKQQGQPDMD